MDQKVYRVLKQLKSVGLIGEGTKLIRRKKRRKGMKKRVARVISDAVQQSGHMVGSSNIFKSTPTVQSEQALINLEASKLQLTNALKNNDVPQENIQNVLLTIKDIQSKENLYKTALSQIYDKVDKIDKTRQYGGYTIEEEDEEEDENPFSNQPTFHAQTKLPTTPTVSTSKIYSAPSSRFFSSPSDRYYKTGFVQNDEDEPNKLPTLSYEPDVVTPRKETPLQKSTPVAESEAPKLTQRQMTYQKNLDALKKEYQKLEGSDDAIINAKTQNQVKKAIETIKLRELKSRYKDLGGDDEDIFESLSLRQVSDAVDELAKQRLKPRTRSSKNK